ncbi:uncharacterized protein LOC117102112 [Anneissia japonica]|uniref:uncharacterized protein LOC117102112 n=1 Tax=Anneissia japonica TaxID=1529436 RepID=UPI001425BB29|nr:uncharacterized protein LOC117102112 [Anneissia japonica]
MHISAVHDRTYPTDMSRALGSWKCVLDDIDAASLIEKLVRYLATGDSYKTISFSYRVGKSTIVGIVPEVCEAIWRLQPQYMPIPGEKDWIEIAAEFQKRWQFPNCIDALDRKHVVIQAPPNSGSTFYNYKGTFSVVLMTLVDAMYCFSIIDVGAYGSNSDGGILAKNWVR